MTLWTVCASCLSIFPTPRICRKSTVCSIGMFCCWQLLPVLKFEFSTTKMPIWFSVAIRKRGSASVPNFFWLCQAEIVVEVLSRPGQTAVKFIDMTLLLNWHWAPSSEDCWKEVKRWWVWWITIIGNLPRVHGVACCTTQHTAEPYWRPPIEQTWRTQQEGGVKVG